MLVVTRTSAIARAKQKPRQWGPISAVRAAVWRNAEQLGIDPRSILVVVPYWRGSGNKSGIIPLCFTDAVWNTMGVNHGATGVTTTGVYTVVSELTVCAGIVIPPYVTNSKYIAEKANNDTSGWRLRALQGRIDFRVDYSVADYRQYYSSSQFTAGEKCNLISVWDGSSASSGHRLYKNGILLTSKYIADDGSGSRVDDSGNQIRIGNRADLTGGFAYDMFYVYIFDAVISAATIDILSQYPYALIRSTPVPIWFDFGASGGTVYDVSLTLAQSLGLQTIGQATANASLALSQQLTASPGGGADTQGSIDLAKTLSADVSGAATASGNVLLSQQLQTETQAAANTAAAVQAQHSFGITITGNALSSADISLALSLAAQFSTGQLIEATIQLSQVLGASTSASASTEGSINLEQQHQLSVQALAQALAELTTLQQTLGIDIEAKSSVVAFLTLAIQQGITVTTTNVFPVSVDLAQKYGINIDAKADVNAEVSIGLALGITLLGQALANANLDISHVVDVSFNGQILSATLKLPDGRTFKVDIDTRIYRVPPEDRITLA